MNKKIVCTIMSIIMTLGLLLANTTNVQAADTIYYVDSVNGNDANNGTSTSTAWQTLGKVNSITFQPGDKILFKRGCTWNEALKPLGSGNSTSRITIDAYGTGALPKIVAPRATNLALGKTYNASSNASDAGYAFDSNPSSYWGSVDNSIDPNPWLEVDFGASTTFNRINLKAPWVQIEQFKLQAWDGLRWNDIYVSSLAVGYGITCRFADVTASKVRLYVTQIYSYTTNVTISNMEVYNDKNAVELIGQSYWTIQNIEVNNLYKNGVFVDFQNSVVTGVTIKGIVANGSAGTGICFGNSRGGHTTEFSPLNGYFENILIEECYIRDFGQGIYIGGNIAEDGIHPRNSNITIRNNYLYNLASNGILVLATNGGTIEKNRYAEAKGTSQYTYCGIWTADSRNLVFQFNEVSGIMDGGDGQAYDCDWGTEHITYQYNYSHNNTGGFISFFAYGQQDGLTESKYYSRYNTIRYNLAIDDKDGFAKIYSSGECHDNIMYNNTAVCGSDETGRNKIVFTDRIYGQNTYGNILKNNIFYNKSSIFTLISSVGTEYILDYNCWYSPNGFSKITWNGTDYTSFSAWKTASGQEMNGIQQDPKLVSTTKGGRNGLKLKQDSPCINAGTNVGSMGSRDYWATTIPVGGSYDIGAYEGTGLWTSVYDATYDNLASASTCTAQASTYDNAVNYPTKAIDGDTGTRWQAAVGDTSNAWLRLDFNGSVTLDKLIVKEYGNNVSSFKIQSWTGSQWQDLYTGTTIGTALTIALGTPVKTANIRLLVVSAANAPGITEMEVYNTNLAMGKKYSASSCTSDGNYTDISEERAFDNNTNTYWSSLLADTQPWIGVDFGTNKTFNTVVLKESNYGNQVTSYKVQYWGGSNWLDAYTGTTIGSGVTDTFPAVTGSKVRLLILSTYGQNPAISEMAVYNQ